MMRRGTLLAITALAVVAAACGKPEKLVIENYFRAVKQGDSQTLSSFATVGFDKKVDDWSIVGTISPNEVPAPLPELTQKMKDAEAAVTQNRREITNYNLDHTIEVDQVKEARKSGGKVPARLQGVAETWDKFIQKDKELKRALSEAKSKVDKERQALTLSVGAIDFDSLTGTLVTEQIDLLVTVEGKQQPYLMTLRQYQLKGGGGVKPLSRWVVTGFDLKK
jgi:hypothetical protein